MKKIFPKLALIMLGVVAGIALSVALYAATRGTLYDVTLGISFDGGEKPDAAADSEMVELSYELLGYIKSGDFTGLSKAAHPEYGVVFSPYATVSLSSNKCFTAEQLAVFGEDSSDYVWGVYIGSGNPIEMTPAEYFARFVFDKDFTKASVLGVNYIVKSGNALENFTEVFPNARFVEFHIPSGDTESGDIGWSSLRLGFEEYGGELRLTVILHSEWTV